MKRQKKKVTVEQCDAENEIERRRIFLIQNRKHCHYIYIALAVGVIIMSVFTGCAGAETKDTKIVLTTGFEKDEVFRIEKTSCRLPEVMLYLTNMQS